MKYVKLFLEEFKKTPIFTAIDIEKFLVSKGSTKNYSKIFIKLMVVGGRAYKVSKGFYTLYNNSEVAGFPYSPFYYGLSFALTKHGLWKQQANPYVITTKNVRRGVRRVLGSNITVSKISKDMFFGYRYVKGANFYYPVSDVEKTFIDLVYFRYGVDDQVYENIAKKVDKKKMLLYLKACAPRVKKGVNRIMQRFG